MASLRDIVIDCENAPSLARFWAAVLEGYEVRPYDDEEIARLASLGLTPDTDPVVFLDGDGSAPDLCFQQVPEPKTTKNRLHLDLESSDRRSEVERLVSFGASVYQEHDGWTTMRDPEGNEFCVVDRRPAG